jgi:hypothetical protein
MAESEIARIRQEIASEYTAAQLALNGFSSGTSKHEFIAARQARIGVLHDQLQTLVGTEAIAIVAETLASLPDPPRGTLLQPPADR